MGYIGAYLGATGGGTDPPPVITLISPITFSTTYTTARVTPIVVDIVDTGGDLGYILVLAKLPGAAYHLVLQGDADAVYEEEYDAKSTISPIADGVRLSFRPDSQWPPGALSVLVVAVGFSGSEIHSTFTWTLASADSVAATSADLRDSVWRWRRRLAKQKCSVISVAIDDNGTDGPGFVLTALALEIGRKSGLDRTPWRGGSNTNTSGSSGTDNGR